MHTLWPIILLIFPRSGFPAPAQHSPSLSLTTPDPPTSNTVGFEPIDPQFAVLSLFKQPPLDEKYWLHTAVMFMGKLCAQSLTDRLQWSEFASRFYNFQLRIEIEYRVVVVPAAGQIEARYLIWASYFAIKRAITTSRFPTIDYQLRLRGRTICTMAIRARSRPFSLSGWNSTDALLQTSSANQSDVSVTESRNSTKLDLSILPQSSGWTTVITYFGREVHMEDIILTISETFLILATRTPLAAVTEAIVVIPPSPRVQLHILPYARAQGQAYMSISKVVMSLSDVVEQLSLIDDKWTEVHFDISYDDHPVAHGLLVKGEGILASSSNGTSIG